MLNFLKQLFCDHEYVYIGESNIAGTDEKVFEVKCEKCRKHEIVFFDKKLKLYRLKS